MGLRIFKKSMIMAVRARKRFVAFSVIYCVLVLMVGFAIEDWRDGGGIGIALTAILGGAIVATAYGFLLTRFRKKEIATLKCIGWGNNDVRKLLIGEIFFVSLFGFFLAFEILIHSLGINEYFTAVVDTPIRGHALLYTWIVVIMIQIPGVLLANARALRVKPIVALRANE